MTPPTPPTTDDIDHAPARAAVIALQAVGELARGLQVLHTEVRMWGKPNRHGQAELDATFGAMTAMLRVLDKALPVALVPPRVLLGQAADAILAEWPLDGSDYVEAENRARDAADLVRHMLDAPVDTTPQDV